MATENVLMRISYLADIDLRIYQFHVVVRTATGVALPGAATSIPLGILQNAPNIGEAALIAPIGCGGISKAVCGATPCAINELAGLEYVGATDAGKVNKAITTQFPLGLCVETGTSEDDLCSILLAPIHKALTEDLP
jgi:hypothetical protein